MKILISAGKVNTLHNIYCPRYQSYFCRKKVLELLLSEPSFFKTGIFKWRKKFTLISGKFLKCTNKCRKLSIKVHVKKLHQIIGPTPDSSRSSDLLWNLTWRCIPLARDKRKLIGNCFPSIPSLLLVLLETSLHLYCVR